MFAFYLINNPDQSSVQIGGYGTSKIMAGGQITWMTLPSHFFWIITITGFRIGEATDPNQISYEFAGLSTVRAVVDTGTSLFYVPNGFVSTFVKSVFQDMSYDTSYYPLYLGSCNRALYKSIFLYNNQQDVYLEVTPENYVLAADIGIPGKCLMGFAANSDNYWLLGDSFLRNYYSIWDEENDRIGFAPKNTATVSPIRTGEPRPEHSLLPE